MAIGKRNVGPDQDGRFYSVDCDCWQCHKDQNAMIDTMIVCPECGNKRCPMANNHRNECSGSNEPGQKDSAYA